MRCSIASQALCGAITVSALALPSTPWHSRAQLVDLSHFKTFPTLDPQEILDKANADIRELFKQGLFKDGPMDDSGHFLDRPLFMLDDLKDKIEDQVENQVKDLKNLKDEIKDKVHDILGGFTNTASQPVNDGSKTAEGQPTSNNPQSTAVLPTVIAVSPVQGQSQDGTDTSNSVASQLANGGAKATAAGTCNPSGSNIRSEWSSYSNGDRTAFVQAIKCLQGKPSGGSQYTGSQNRYEDLVAVHRGMTANIHQTAAFLVWHRYFVWVFEQMLREECGFDRALPWWDETQDAGAFAASDLFSDAWFGHLPAKTSNGQGTCIQSGEFNGTTLHVGPGSANQNHCLSRAVDESQTSQCNSDFTSSCLSMSAYDDFRHCFELGPHGYGHNGIGAVMAEVSSSVGDPIFFMHHTFVDHTFRIWQNANPSRTQTISGCADAANPCTPISLSTTLSSNGLQPDMTVSDVLNTLGGAMCYRYDY